MPPNQHETEREKRQAARIRELLDEVEELRERLEQLESATIAVIEDEPWAEALTRSEKIALGQLLKAPRCTKDHLYAALYSGRFGAEDDVNIKIVDVWICKLRAKLKKLAPDIEIETIWGVGYRAKRRKPAEVPA